MQLLWLVTLVGVSVGLFALLRNQDPAKDHECADKIRSSMHKFRSTLDEGDSFCVGAAVSLADVHCGPFLYRLSVARLKTLKRQQLCSKHGRHHKFSSAFNWLDH